MNYHHQIWMQPLAENLRLLFTLHLGLHLGIPVLHLGLLGLHLGLPGLHLRIHEQEF